VGEWDIFFTEEVGRFLDDLRHSDWPSYLLVNEAILMLEANGPAERRPLVDSIVGSKISNLKELRPGSAGRSEIRILFAFDLWRSAILLVAGDKSGHWARWYKTAIPLAERLYDEYLTQRRKDLER
jgi:hypothetical protein